MDSSNKNSKVMPTVFQVRDAGKLFKTVLLLAILGWFAYMCDRGVAWDQSRGLIDWSKIFEGYNLFRTSLVIVFNLLSLVTLLRLRALWNGVAIDTEAGTLKFPGGNISPNDFFDFFKPGFLFQYVLRKTVALDDIRELYQQSKLVTLGNVSGYRHAIVFNGSFGAAKVWFNSQGKCDQIYSAIRQLNSMGSPIFRA